MPEQLSVTEFLEFTKDDVDNPSQTIFTSKLGLCRGTIAVLEEVRNFVTLSICLSLQGRFSLSLVFSNFSIVNSVFRLTVWVPNCIGLICHLNLCPTMSDSQIDLGWTPTSIATHHFYIFSKRESENTIK